MVKITKRMRKLREQINIHKEYDIIEALKILKELALSTFIESVDIAIQLGIDTRKANQNIRGSVILPHGIGRKIKVAVFSEGENSRIAKNAGADVVGMEDLAQIIKKDDYDFDVIIASPDAMPLVSQLGHILGPKGLMPNPKIGTVTSDIGKAVTNAKLGQINYRNDKNGIIHTIVGKVDFDEWMLKENIETLLISIKKNQPAKSSGNFLKQIHISTTMGIGIKIHHNSLSLIN
ncbi:50S ribosomal protein L1 [Candidatus Schneideria nysicola]|uniref:50S ribosomal protein L1 n=1 Tax=Candidatus Schneideria nysicola TaxID=1081631 RepID=UPI001CAA626C|nr:50S ribosomal protein L1 [Candidatus Schneideria nysicola]UAJ65486.1 50S ribosomal protein L1 [Candidatus Schneideria nysicola]